MESPRHFIASPYPSSFFPRPPPCTALLGSGERGGRKRREVGSDSLVGARCEERRREGEAAGAQLIFRKRRERRRSSEPINYENTTFLPPPRFPREKKYQPRKARSCRMQLNRQSELFPFPVHGWLEINWIFFSFSNQQTPSFHIGFSAWDQSVRFVRPLSSGRKSAFPLPPPPQRVL